MIYFPCNPIYVILYFYLTITNEIHESCATDFNYHRIEERNYMVIAPKTIRPYVNYGIMVHVFDFYNEISNRTFTFYGTVTSGNDEITSMKKDLFFNNPQISYLPVPMSLVSDNYMLHISGISNADKRILFNDSFRLFYHSDFVSVVFQTTRPIYSAGQTIKFRILVLETSLLPFNDVLDVFIVDPDDVIMKRWLSIYTNNDNVASLKFKLPKLTKNGIWKIRSKIHGQVDEKSVIVETYFQPYFEVIVSSPAYIFETEDNLKVTFYGMFSTQKLVRGNATVVCSARKFSENGSFFEIQKDYMIVKESRHEITLPLILIREMFDTIIGVEIKIFVIISEFMTKETSSGFSHTRIITNNVKIQFLSKSPIIFTPGMPLFGIITVCLANNERVSREVLQNSTLKVVAQTDMPFVDGKHVSEVVVHGTIGYMDRDFYDLLAENELRRKYLNMGIVDYEFDIPKNTTNLALKAIYQNGEQILETTIKTVGKFSVDKKFINVWTSSKDLKVNEYAMVHIKTNFYFKKFYSSILSKGILLHIQEHDISESSSLMTFSTPVSSDMAPLFHLIVYCFSNNREIYSDSVTIPVDGFSRFETTFEVNTGKDFRNERVEAIASGGEGAFIGIQASRSIIFHLQGKNEITRSRIAKSFLKFENNLRSIWKMDWISGDGSFAEETVFFPSFNFVHNAFDNFNFNHLIVSTDWKLSDNRHVCDLNFISCLTIGCIPKSELCDGKQDCDDGSDESNCLTTVEDHTEYFLYRTSRNYFIYDPLEGDWAFREIKKNDHVGIEFEFLFTPETSDDWYFVVFNMHMVYGFSMIESPIIFSSAKPLMAHIKGPHKCHCGEQLGLKLHLHNNDRNQMLITITLLASDDYKFVHVENDGIVNSYAARLSSGNYEKLIYMPAESEIEIRFPVAPAVEKGLIEINFHISSQSGRKNLTHVVNVLGEGALINRHTSSTLDFKNRGLILQYLDIVIEENPYVPYEYWRRYVYGSASANVSLSNDLMGPINLDNPIFLNSLLKREAKGAADFAFELNSNIWILHYSRLTRQLESNFLNDMLKECNVMYMTVMRYFNPEVGCFSNWEPPSVYSSVWLSSWVLRILKYASFSEWQFSFWVDPQVFQKTLKWLLTFQQMEGNFLETSDYENPIDSRFIVNNISDHTISLTAHILITLQCVMDFVNGDLKTDVIISSKKARIYLERILPSVENSYFIAMISYALLITNSPEKGYAFSLLQKHARINEDGLTYWSNVPISSNPIKIENQKTFHLPRLYGNTDSTAVEATSWALLVYMANEGITPTIESIVQWLISMKMSNLGFISVVDTSVAYQALTEFAFRSRFLDLTSINVDVEMMAANMTKHTLHINNEISSSYILKIPSVWGHVNIRGKGSGIAYIQMDVDYGIDYENLLDKPTIKQFELKITEFYSTFRNKSEIIIQTCLRYDSLFRTRSGAVVLEIQIPTGYFLVESEANKIVNFKSHPTLRDARTTEEKTVWFFDYLDHQQNCFNHSVRRWYPVANMTLYRQALIYELTARENFVQILINSTPLYTLSICEVCGSFQCPYCPYFNDSTSFAMIDNRRLILFLFLMTVLNRINDNFYE